MPKPNTSHLCASEKKDIRLDAISLLLRALVDDLDRKGVISEQQLRERLINRHLHWRNAVLRYLVKLLNRH